MGGPSTEQQTEQAKGPSVGLDGGNTRPPADPHHMPDALTPLAPCLQHIFCIHRGLLNKVMPWPLSQSLKLENLRCAIDILPTPDMMQRNKKMQKRHLLKMFSVVDPVQRETF